MMDQRISSAVYVKVLIEPMKILPGVSPSKEMRDRMRHRKKSFTSAGIEICFNEKLESSSHSVLISISSVISQVV